MIFKGVFRSGMLYLISTVLLVLLMLLIFKPMMLYDNLISGKAIIENGVLQNAQSFREGVYELTGTVQTFESQFIASKTKNEQFESTAFPLAWQASEGISFASHRIVLKDLDVNQVYGLYLMDALTAYSVYIDGELIGTQGRVAANSRDSVPASKAQSLFFHPSSPEVELIIHISNHEASIMGVWQKTLFGKADKILEYEHRANLSDAFIIGAIFFLSIYMWILHLVLKKELTTLYFSLACIFVGTKTLFSGQQLGFEILPMITYDLGLRIAYIMIPAILVSFIAFARECFKDHIPLLYLKMSLAVSFMQALVILFVPQKTYMSTFIVYQIFIFISCAMIFVWIIQAIICKREGAWIYLLGYAAFFGFAINDILYSQLVIQTGYYLGFGLFLLIMSQATLIAIYYARALKTEAYLKGNLESIIVERTIELEQERNKFENLSRIDSLTLLYNRGHLNEVLNYEFEGYRRYKSPLSVIILDLDRFKAINDTYGHVFGDQVLKRISEVLKENSRKADVVGRFGGEEFMIITRLTTLQDAVTHAEHIRGLIEGITFDILDQKVSVTASFGVAEASEELHDEEDLILAADLALYRAKANGRNCVLYHEVQLVTPN